VDESRSPRETGTRDSLNEPSEERREESVEEPLPEPLRRRLRDLAEEWPDYAAPPRARAIDRAGWFAAAACLALAVAGWWPTLQRWSGVRPSLAELQSDARAERERLLEKVPDIGHWGWDPDAGLRTQPRGDVVWDNAGQRGYLVLGGLPPSEPGKTQYQLWVFDAARDERYPVDGGVFDVPSGHDTIVVPIRAALHIFRPAAFAVTLESAGGVVVSDRQRVVALAHVAEG
jgi:anti-sigma-K factor RskA